MKLSIAEYKNHAEMLGRFANIREGAPEPTDRILVQFDKVLKFVAGDDISTVIVDTGTPVETQGKAVVSSRLLLQAAKTLRGKGDVELELDGKGGMVLRTNTGGKVVLPRIGDSVPGWVRPSSEFATALALGIPASFWPDLSKVIAVGPDKHRFPWDQLHFEVQNSELRLLWTDNYRLVEHNLGAVALGEFKYVGSVPADFIKSLKAFEGETSLVMKADRIEVHHGESSALSMLRIALDRDGKRLYELPYAGHSADQLIGATVNRKDFIDNIKAVSSADEHKRVTVAVSAGEVKVYGYHHEGEGSMTQTAIKTQGRGMVSFQADLATKLLAGLSGKEMEFYFPHRGTGAIRFKEGKWGWRMFLAPVAL